MSKLYTGLCVLRDTAGVVFAVAVRDDNADNGNLRNVLSPGDYRERDIQPALETLPDCPE
jgi:hypothetical protein